MMRHAPGLSAIDRTQASAELRPDPELIARFAADLAALRRNCAPFGLAVSGGPDSMALLLLAHAALPGAIEAATVDHGLRAEAAAEAEFVASICASLGVPHVTLGVRLAPGNLQSEARVARYSALADWACERGIGAIATAHHADDQAETLLLRLGRASGVAGLAGVRAVGSAGPNGVPAWFNRGGGRDHGGAGSVQHR
jgi:tRNA(Ile)-lysidine synthase